MSHNVGPAGRLAGLFINSKLTPLIIIAGILLGLASVIALPREEEPQIIVPMVDIFVQMPGASSKEVEQRVTTPMENLLWEIPGVEYIYSTSSPGQSMTIVRFYVGEDEEKAIVRLQSKLMANYDRIPFLVSQPLVKPRSINDVPILALTFWSESEDHFTLRRVVAELEQSIKRVPDVSITHIIGGQKRQVEVLLDPVRLAAYNLDAATIEQMLSAANAQAQAGSFPTTNGQILVTVGGFLKTVQDVRQVVVGVHQGRPVYLDDVAAIEEGPAELDNYVFFGTGPAAGEKGIEPDIPELGDYPAVTLSVAKRKGTNAVALAEQILKQVESVRGTIIPEDIHMTVTRNYGDTAEEKSNELLFHMVIAVFSVTLLIWFALGHRESLIVALAIPVTLALTLFIFFLLGYTLNRITLFALIFSIGILVDDAIVVVENIVRHFRLPSNRDKGRFAIAIEAVSEVGNPTILATGTVIAAILPMAFVGGLMGPYMRPIPVGASAAMVFSLLVAFIVTPWAAVRILGKRDKSGAHMEGEKEDWTTRLYRRFMNPLIHEPAKRWAFLILVVVLLLGACAMIGVGLVRVKMLPFDNKSEFQVIINMPTKATLEQTSGLALAMGDYLRTVNEVVDYQVYVGTAAPFNFNGLVRHYYLRQSPWQAEINVNLAGKGKRQEQSHAIAKRVRPDLKKIADLFGARIQVTEVPPGPPVLSTLVSEIYGPDYNEQRDIARKVMDIYENTEGVVDVDWYMESDQPRYYIAADPVKAALHGIGVDQITRIVSLNLKGKAIGLLHAPSEREDVDIMLRSPLPDRAGIDRLLNASIKAPGGQMVPLSELVTVRKENIDKSIYHKNLMEVVYVIGDVAGAKESPVYAILEMRNKIDDIAIPGGYRIHQLYASMPDTEAFYSMKWDGEWQITYEVFRDLGISFAVVLVLIFILVVGWFQSFTTPLVIMAAIPFSLIGILPAHWALGAFFTATSMIGFIAGAGIVVRNSIILVDFVELRLAEGMPLDEAVVDAGAVRFRPMMLTAAAVVVGASVILFDPIFQGLAISLMAGEVASLLFSRMTVPILYYMDKRWEHDHLKG